jgi:hypothetical protein
MYNNKLYIKKRILYENEKMLNLFVSFGAICSLVSCGEKQVSRDEAKSNLTNMSTADIAEPNKYTFITTTSSSGGTTNLKTSDTTLTSVTNMITFSLDDHYFYLDTTGNEFKIVLFEKDSVLNIYTNLLGVKTTAKIDISFVDEMKKIKEQYEFDIVQTMKDLYKSCAEKFIGKI